MIQRGKEAQPDAGLPTKIYCISKMIMVYILLIALQEIQTGVVAITRWNEFPSREKSVRQRKTFASGLLVYLLATDPSAPRAWIGMNSMQKLNSKQLKAWKRFLHTSKVKRRQWTITFGGKFTIGEKIIPKYKSKKRSKRIMPLSRSVCENKQMKKIIRGGHEHDRL